jgi:hypothetical protein
VTSYKWRSPFVFWIITHLRITYCLAEIFTLLGHFSLSLSRISLVDVSTYLLVKKSKEISLAYLVLLLWWNILGKREFLHAFSWNW